MGLRLAMVVAYFLGGVSPVPLAPRNGAKIEHIRAYQKSDGRERKTRAMTNQKHLQILEQGMARCVSL